MTPAEKNYFHSGLWYWTNTAMLITNKKILLDDTAG